MRNSLRRSEAAVALVRRRGAGGQSQWLARWNSQWGAFHFVAGHRRPEESFRACLVREIAEELGLGEGEDYIVSRSPPLHLELTAWSVSARAETWYAMELFDVELTPAAQSRIVADPENCWLSEIEIRAGRCVDGKAISATMVRLLDEGRLWRETGVM